MFSQEEYSPEDPANPCVNYPTEEYESYADCDDHFVRSFLPPGLKPFWTVDNISEATNTFDLDYDFYAKTYGNLGNYIQGLKISYLFFVFLAQLKCSVLSHKNVNSHYSLSILL